jgi:hypothetical protein
MSIRRVVWVLAVVAVATGGCSSTTSQGPTNVLTSAQANWVAGVVAAAAANGANSSSASAVPPMASGPQRVAVNVSVDYTHTCNVAGNIHILGTLSGSISDSGTGVLLLGMTETLSGCRTQTTSGGWFEMNGDPYLSATGTFSFVNGTPGTQQSMSIGGGFKWAFDTGQSNSCSMMLSVLFNTVGGGGSVSGTVCGVSVNQTLS